MKEQKGGDSPITTTEDANEKAAASMKVIIYCFVFIFEYQFQVGDRCEVRVKEQMPRRGCVAFLGHTQFKSGYWVGVRYVCMFIALQSLEIGLF